MRKSLGWAAVVSCVKKIALRNVAAKGGHRHFLAHPAFAGMSIFKLIYEH